MIQFPTVDYSGKRIPNPSTPLTEGVKASTLIVVFDDSHEQRRRKGIPTLTWSLEYIALTDAAYRRLRDFYFVNTEVNSFSWTHPISKIVYKVRFDGGFQGDNFGHNGKTPLWKMNFKLQQVL